MVKRNIYTTHFVDLVEKGDKVVRVSATIPVFIVVFILYITLSDVGMYYTG